MSHLIMGPASQPFFRGKAAGPLIARCCCKCHSKVLCARTLSARHSFGSKHSDDWSSNQNHKVLCQPAHLHSFSSSTHSSFFKSKYLIRPAGGISSSFSDRTHQTLLPRHTPIVCDDSAVFSSYLAASYFHTSTLLWKETSKIEKTVKALKETIVGKEGQTMEEPVAVKKEVAKPEPAPATAPVVKKTIWQKVLHELKHYYHGFRLLFIDMSICIRLLWNVLNGQSLTRRERRQMVRTTADMFRLVPFLVFVIVPFMEFLLPVAIKLFPNMLPSTFKDENTEQEKLKKNLKVKLTMAKFLQETIHETALQKKKKTESTDKQSAVEEFSQFVDKIRSEGSRPTTKEILKFAKLFENEITLDNMPRQQLQAVCRVLNIQPIGIDALLRFQLDMKLRQLKADDKMIVKEGIDTLSMAELQSANRARGMRALGVSEERLKGQLQQWLTLHLDERIPTSLLLLSRALYLPESLSAEQQLEATITEMVQSAPATTTEATLKVAELAGENVDNKVRLEIIKQEERIIKEESKARKEEEAARKEEKARVEVERQQAEAMAGQALMNTTEELRDTAPAITTSKAEELVDKAPKLVGVAGEELEKKKKEEEEDHITAKELEEIESALEEIAVHKQLSIEKDELQDLKEEVNEYKEDLQDLKEVMVLGGADQDTMVESKAAKRLAKRVDRLIQQADTVMCELQAEKERFQKEQEEKEKDQEAIEFSEVHLKRSAELKEDDARAEEVLQKISEQKDNIVSINEMLLALRRLQKVPNDTKLQRIIEVLDDDQDGNININLALKVLEVLGHENVKLNKVQVLEMINLLKAEMELEEEEKRIEKMEKEQQQQQPKSAEQDPKKTEEEKNGKVEQKQ